MRIVSVFMLVSVCLLPAGAQKSNREKATDDPKKVTRQLKSLKETDKELKKAVSNQQSSIEELNNKLAGLKSDLAKTSELVEPSVEGDALRRRETDDRIEEIGRLAAVNKLVFTLLGLVLAILGLGGFFYLARKTAALGKRSEENNGHEKLNRDIEARLDEFNARDSEFLDLLERTFSLLQERSTMEGLASENIDHNLPLRVGDEIHRMRKRINNMPQDVKGLGALRNSLARLEEGFNEKGYEIMELVGRHYNDGMHVEARFVDDPNVPPGLEIITDVLRPQINFRDKVIQAAKVEVGKSY